MDPKKKKKIGEKENSEELTKEERRELGIYDGDEENDFEDENDESWRDVG